MSTNNIGPWICDTCGEDIVDPLGGLVIWQTEGVMAQNFRVVHKGKCDWNDTHKMSLEIENFIGADGLALLLSWLSYGPVRPYDNGDRVADKDEYVVLVRRMQTPGYERARQYFRTEAVQDEFADGGDVLPYVTTSLARIIEVGESGE